MHAASSNEPTIKVGLATDYALLEIWSAFSLRSLILFIGPCCSQKKIASFAASESSLGALSLMVDIGLPQRGHFKLDYTPPLEFDIPT